MSDAPSSRYQRMRRVLDEAAEGSRSSYQGNGRFWDLPLATLLELELYGVRMIAPAGGASDASPEPPARTSGSTCCHARVDAKPAATPASRPSRGRGAASGLIKGLRGQAPFDGVQFPRLPWGGRAVAATDIAMIEGWIDDGCPTEDAAAPAVVSVPGSMSDRALGLEDHPLATGPTNAFHADSGGLKLRKNIDALGPEELRRLRSALRQMHRYDDFVLDERGYAYWARIHGNNCQHGWEEFLPWHRLYLYFFELALQDIDPTVTVPYWDWAAYYDQDRAATTPDSGVIPPAFRCSVDEAVLAALTGKVADDILRRLRGVVGRDFNSGSRLFQAAGIRYGADPAADDAIMNALMDENPLFYRLRWPGGNNSLLFEDYPAPADIERILAIDSFFDFASGPEDNHFYGAVENLHNLIHNFSGGINPNWDPATPQQSRKEPQYGDMVAPGVTAFDPIFWCHHSNVDRLWAEWQKRHPGAGPDNPAGVLPPWSQTVGDTQNIARFGYEYAHSVHVFPTRPDMHLTRFRSAKVDAAAARRPAPRGLGGASHNLRAEVRLHGVQHRLRGGTLRVFLNAPHADETTETRGNIHYAGQFHLFAGDCIGGEGHCNVPARTRRAFDARPRHRKTPGHLRLDVTAIVERLLARGDRTIHVHVLALDHAGKPAGDVLRLDGVGLYFFD